MDDEVPRRAVLVTMGTATLAGCSSVLSAEDGTEVAGEVDQKVVYADTGETEKVLIKTESDGGSYFETESYRKRALKDGDIFISDSFFSDLQRQNSSIKLFVNLLLTTTDPINDAKSDEGMSYVVDRETFNRISAGSSYRFELSKDGERLVSVTE